ncbi:MAG: thioredoxin family protein [Planctomycetota bacterium]|nr:MAG: thioredoxin family protein [Planctomycetota bacterium]
MSIPDTPTTVSTLPHSVLTTTSAPENVPPPKLAVPVKLPRMVDIGADKCIPCKMMAPILKELKREYAGRAEIEFIDAWKNPSAGRKYGIRTIPTQIFYDRTGKEVWRHEGFLSRSQIVAKFKEMGL